MSSEPTIAIEARGLGKAYQIFGRPEDRLKQILFGWRKKYYRESWALRGINLAIHKGETVGIVGRNGAGKSTLLQLITGVLKPSEGTLNVNGRVAALLELGTGFNPEFTGRENIFFNGQLLGHDPDAIAKRFDAIAAFADIGLYLDQPLRTYSSGMSARLAFAIAIHADPEILIVDEALSVGDEAFQRKCFSRLEEIREAGATILLVSHSASTIVDVCDHAVLIDQGECLCTGEPKMVVAKYQRLAYAPPDKAAIIREHIRANPAAAFDAVPDLSAEQPTNGEAPSASYDPSLLPRSTIAYASRGVIISDAHIRDLAGKRVNILAPGETYRYSYAVTFDQPGWAVRFGMMIKTVLGTEVAGASSHPDGSGVEQIPAGQTLTITFEFQNLFNPGTYFINAGVLGMTEGGYNWLHRVLDAAIFRVEPTPRRTATGMVNLITGANCRIEPAKETVPT